jgi:predicted MFS family arabinose efflux permease
MDPRALVLDAPAPRAMGCLADRHLTHRLLAAGAGAAAVANLLPAPRPDAVVALGSRFPVGAAPALVLPVARKATASWHRSGRGEAIGTVLAGLCVATATPHVLRTTELGWRTAFVTTSVLGRAGAAFAWCRVEVGPHGFDTPAFDPRHALRPFRAAAVRRAYVGYFGRMWELYGYWVNADSALFTTLVTTHADRDMALLERSQEGMDP